MILLLALTVAVLFGAGVFLMLERDLPRMVVGVLLISQAGNLFLMASGLLRGEAPIQPLALEPVSDPLVQALTLTAVVISFGVAALLLALVLRVQEVHHSVRVEDVLAAAEREEEAAEREEMEEEPEKGGGS